MTDKIWEMDELQTSIFGKKYNPQGLTFGGWLDRVSGGNPRIRKLIADKCFIFAGRILAHRGLKEKVTYSNCYVQPAPEDNLESIFDTAKELARTYSYGGGCGTDISKLRPRSSKVNNSAKETTGAVSFMSLFDLTTGLIGQNGRRGALMLSIADSHPDLPEFLTIKAEQGMITKANISVRISRAFMEAVMADEEWTMRFVVKDTGEVIERTMKATDLFRVMCETNWDWAEAGMLFWDEICEWHLMSEHPEHEFGGVNPCGEEPLMSYGSCLLGSMNLSRYVLFPFTPDATFDYDKFGQDVEQAVIGLNEVLDEGIRRHPLKKQRKNAKLWRQIGLGMMGQADMFIKMGLEYGSDESFKLANQVSHFMLNIAVMASAKLAKEKGTFPKYNREALFKSKFFQENIEPSVQAYVFKNGLRNSQIMTIAPTGTISTMWGVSGGIEPLFAVSYFRTTESLHGKPVTYEVFPEVIREYMDFHGLTSKDQLPDFIVNSTADKLDYKKRVIMQGIWQHSIDASISSTVNLPNSATAEDVANVFILAHKSKLKGITIYRDGCKRAGILNIDSKEASEEVPNVEIPEIETEVNGYKMSDKFVTCPDCGEKIQLITNGCSICMNCGFSPCS